MRIPPPTPNSPERKPAARPTRVTVRTLAPGAVRAAGAVIARSSSHVKHARVGTRSPRPTRFRRAATLRPDGDRPLGDLARGDRRRRSPSRRRRARLRRHGLGGRRRPGALALGPRVRRDRRPADLQDALRARPRTRHSPLWHPLRRLLPGGRLARWRVPGRPGGLLLPAQLRHLLAGPARPRTRPRGRGELRAATRQAGEAQPHRRVPALELHGPGVEPGWALATGADRDDGPGADRGAARARP